MPIRLLHTDDLRSVVRNRKGLVQYNDSLKKFELKDIKEIEEQLSAAVDDSDLPDEFVEFLEDKLDVDEMVIRTFDGGSFCFTVYLTRITNYTPIHLYIHALYTILVSLVCVFRS